MVERVVATQNFAYFKKVWIQYALGIEIGSISWNTPTHIYFTRQVMHEKILPTFNKYLIIKKQHQR